MMSLFDPHHASYEGHVAEHRQWLGNYCASHLTKWNQDLVNDPEAALAEAEVRRFLQSQGLAVSPGEGLDGVAGGPDFRCVSAGHEFFVEVTAIPEEKADRATGFKTGELGAKRFFPLNEAIFNKCDAKAKQCGKRKAPVLLAITTFSESSLLAFSPSYPEMLLTGMTDHFVEIDKASGKSIGERKYSNLEFAAFLCLDDEEGIVPARHAISGLLLCGLRYDFFVGVLNPSAAYPFDPGLLSGLNFATVTIDNKEQLRVNSRSEETR